MSLLSCLQCPHVVPSFPLPPCPAFLLQIPNLNLPTWLGLENLNENAVFYFYLFIFYTSGPFSKWPDGVSLSTVLIAKENWTFFRVPAGVNIFHYFERLERNTDYSLLRQTSPDDNYQI